jgi:DNA-binding transcriptional regulator YdaS (Cro superfamily)
MKPVARAIEAAGGIAQLAKLCNVRYQAVQKWRATNRLPAERVLEVERFSGVPRSELRPDLYPAEVA